MSARRRPSATSLPPSPRDDEAARFRNYIVTMGIRIACFILMVAVQPYGWYTWIFGAGAVFLPYIAVVLANVGHSAHETTAETPERALTAAPGEPDASADADVIQIAESSAPVPFAAPARDDDGTDRPQ